MSPTAPILRGIIFGVALATQCCIPCSAVAASEVPASLEAIESDKKGAQAESAVSLADAGSTSDHTNLLRRDDLDSATQRKGGGPPPIMAGGGGGGGCPPPPAPPPPKKKWTFSLERKAKMVEIQFKSKKKTTMSLSMDMANCAEEKIKKEEKVKKKAKEGLCKSTEKAKKVAGGAKEGEAKAKEGEAKPKEERKKKVETEKKMKELKAKEKAFKEMGQKEKIRKKEKADKEAPWKETVTKRGVNWYKGYMNHTEEKQKAGLKDSAKELANKEHDLSRRELEYAKANQERGAKRDARLEFVPKQHAQERTCKVKQEKNAKKVSAKEGTVKREQDAVLIQKAKKSAEEAVEMEKEAKYKLGAQSEQLEKRKFAPAALEKDTKEKESKHKGMAEHTAKTASSAIEKAKVKLDKSDSSESATKAQLKISTENNEKAAKRESKLALEEMQSSKKASLSEGKSKESFQKSWEVTNEKEGKSERTSKDKKEHTSKQKSESFIKKQQSNTTQEEVAQHNLVERKDKEHVESLSEWRMNTLKNELAAERKKERVTKFREATDKTFEIGTAAKKKIVGPNEGTIKKAKVEVNDKRKKLSTLKHSEAVTKAKAKTKDVETFTEQEEESKKAIAESKEHTKERLKNMEDDEKISEDRFKLKMKVQVKHGEPGQHWKQIAGVAE